MRAGAWGIRKRDQRHQRGAITTPPGPFSPVLVKERVLTFGPDGALAQVALYVERYRRS